MSCRGNVTLVRAENYGVYYILEHGARPTFRVTVPKYPTKDANYRDFWRVSAATSPTTISTSVTKPSARWSFGSPRSCRSRPRITSML